VIPAVSLTQLGRSEVRTADVCHRRSAPCRGCRCVWLCSFIRACEGSPSGFDLPAPSARVRRGACGRKFLGSALQRLHANRCVIEDGQAVLSVPGSAGCPILLHRADDGELARVARVGLSLRPTSARSALGVRPLGPAVSVLRRGCPRRHISVIALLLRREDLRPLAASQVPQAVPALPLSMRPSRH
jgi:hypothetical protein